MAKKYFLFDLDGTLTDTGPGIMECIQKTLADLGLPPREEAFLRRFVGPPLAESFQNLCGMSPEEAARAIQIYRGYYVIGGVYKSPLYPGVEQLLKRLSQAAVLGVATSKNESGARRILAMRGIEERFQVVVGDDGSRPSKAAVVAEVLERLGNPAPAEAVMVGDRSYDIAGAAAWGLEAVGVLYGYAAPGELQEAGARYLAATVEELEALCFQLAAGTAPAWGPLLKNFP